MARIVVLLNSKKEQITNSLHQLQAHVTTPLINFPASGAMPETIEWDGMEFTLMDQPTHEDDHAGAELFRYLEKVETKECFACGKVQPISEFTTEQGLDPICKSCILEDKELTRIAVGLAAVDGGSARINSVKQRADEAELARIAAALKK